MGFSLGGLFKGLFGSSPGYDKGFKGQVGGNLSRLNELMGLLYGPNALFQYMNNAATGFDTSAAARTGAGLTDLSSRFRARGEGTGGTLYGASRDRFMGNTRAQAPYQILGGEMNARMNMGNLYNASAGLYKHEGSPGLLGTVAQGVGLYQGLKGIGTGKPMTGVQPNPYGTGGGGYGFGGGYSSPSLVFAPMGGGAGPVFPWMMP